VQNGTNTEMEVQGDTIYHPLQVSWDRSCRPILLTNFKPYTPSKATGEVLLLPFTQYPRFISCDRQQNVYLIRADARDQRAYRLGRTDTAIAGLILPDDESFLMIRGSEHERQRADKFALSFMGVPSFRVSLCGKIYSKFNSEVEGCAARLYGDTAVTCFLTLLRGGWLVRKTL